jgi:hypothetical protein
MCFYTSEYKSDHVITINQSNVFSQNKVLTKKHFYMFKTYYSLNMDEAGKGIMKGVVL